MTWSFHRELAIRRLLAKLFWSVGDDSTAKVPFESAGIVEDGPGPMAAPSHHVLLHDNNRCLGASLLEDRRLTRARPQPTI